MAGRNGDEPVREEVAPRPRRGSGRAEEPDQMAPDEVEEMLADLTRVLGESKTTEAALAEAFGTRSPEAAESWASLYRFLAVGPTKPVPQTWNFMLAATETDDCHWVTMNGGHVCIGGKGHVPHVRGEGKSPRAPKGGALVQEEGDDSNPQVVIGKPGSAASPAIPDARKRSDVVGHIKGVKVHSVDEAYRLLTEKQKVILAKPQMVSTLLDKLADEAQKAKASGGKLEINLCDVSVEGTNIFCAENMGLTRIMMPQLSGTPLPGSPADKLPRSKSGHVDIGPAFKQHLADQGIKIEDTDLPAKFLKATQNEMNGAKVGELMKVIESGQRSQGLDKRIFTSKDDYVLDGHHRWAAQVGIDYRDAERENRDMNIAVSRVDLPILDVLVKAHKFAEEMGIPPLEHHAHEVIEALSGIVQRLAERHPFVRKPYAESFVLDSGERIILDVDGQIVDGPLTLVGARLPALD